MPLPVEWIALALAAAAPGQQPPPGGTGPSAASNEGERYDAVGYAALADLATGAGHAALPVGSFVEVTALDSGRTVLLMVAEAVAAQADRPVALSADAMRQLGIEAGAPVRVRSARPSPPDIAALRAGQPATARLDAPPVLLAGLRNALPPRRSASAMPTAAAPSQKPPVAPPRRLSASAPAPRPPAPAVSREPAAPPQSSDATAAGWGVQVAALSNAANARALAAALGGRVSPVGNLYRVQLGPFADRAAAEAARAGAVRRGHAGAALVRLP